MKSLKAFLILMFACSVGVYAQQVPLFTQYQFNQSLYNPARVADHDAFTGTFTHRRQWAGFEGAPRILNVNAEGPVFNNRPNVALGANVFNDQSGLISRTGANLRYNYTLNFGKRDSLGRSASNLTFGLAIGFMQNSIDWGRARYINPNDPAIGNAAGIEDGVLFDGAFGLAFRWRGLTLGAAGLQLLGNQANYPIQNDVTNAYSFIQHWVGTAEYEFQFGGKHYITPSVILRGAFDGGVPIQMDASIMYNWNRAAWIGATYRLEYGLAAMAGVTLYDRISIGYSYDFATNDISDFTTGTHEVMVRYRFGDRKKDIDTMGEDGSVVPPIVDPEIKELQERSDSLESQIDSLEEMIKDIKKNGGGAGGLTPDEVKDLKEQLDEMKERKRERDNARDELGQGSQINNDVRGVNFPLGDSRLPQGLLPYLDQTAETLKKYPNVRIEIQGHASTDGPDDLNQRISDQRAANVKKYLISKGVSPGQLETRGYSDRKLLDPENPTSPKNRRVEYRILEQ